MELVTAGDSHGKFMTAVLSGIPAGLRVDLDLLRSELRRRCSGSGRSQRLESEHDNVQIISGVIDCYTTGAPISFLVENMEGQSLIEKRVKEKGFPRPGHVDLASFKKYGLSSIQIGAERASARETVLKVSAGVLCKMMLNAFSVSIESRVIEIGGIPYENFDAEKELSTKMSAGGILVVSAKNIPIGLGSNIQWNRRLDSRLSAALMSIPSVKGFFIGDTDIHRKRGVESLDHFDGSLDATSSNLSGGIDGGFSNGNDIVITLFFKPIPTQPDPVQSFSVFDGSKGNVGGGRNDLWCIDRAQVIAESMTAFILADVFTEKFGSDNMDDMISSFRTYLKRLKG